MSHIIGKITALFDNRLKMVNQVLILIMENNDK
jgi:hypothetical protein